MPFDILADPSKETTKAYGAVWSPAPGVELASRTTFLISPDGKIAKHWAKVHPKGHSDMVLAEIKAQSSAKASKAG